MSKAYLTARLRWYYPLERFNAFLFIGVMLYVIHTYGFLNTVFLNYGLFVMVFILIQGQHYWKLKLYSLTGIPFDQRSNLALFRRSEQMNVVLICLMPFIVLLQRYLSHGDIGPDNLFGWAIFANVFAVLEHINYYHRQLMIDNPHDWAYLRRNKKLKIASLKKDLRDHQI
jgi:hypothetical protein